MNVFIIDSSKSFLLSFIHSVNDTDVLFLFLDFCHHNAVELCCVAYMSASTWTRGLSKGNQSHIAYLKFLRNNLFKNCLIVAKYLVLSLYFLINDDLEFIIEVIHCFLLILRHSLVFHVWTINEVISFTSYPVVFFIFHIILSLATARSIRCPAE